MANQVDADEVKRRGWLDNGILVVSIHDDRLSWPEVELIKELGRRLYGTLPADKP